MPADNDLEKCTRVLAEVIETLDAHGLDLAARLAGAANLAIKMHMHNITAEELELVQYLAERELHRAAPGLSEDEEDPE
jgi:hypothetical protein